MRAADLPFEIRRIMAPKLKESFFGPSPSIFVGYQGYPNVNAGPLGILEDIIDIDDPSKWIGKDYSEIISLRAMMIRSKKKQNIFSRERFTSEMQDISLAVNKPDIEVNFKKRPLPRMSFSRFMQPMGPSGQIERFRLAENPDIPKYIEDAAAPDMKAKESASSLYDRGIDVYKITTILSAGSLGIDRKMVPTRWSITATDDIIGKSLIEKIREYRQVDKISVFESSHLDNHFIIMIMPGSWEFENFEAWARGSYWASRGLNIEEEYEPFEGRKTYAEKQAGGYYASRLAIAEHLHRIRRQARVLAIREIYEGYSVPLGVWQVRENVRSAFRLPGREFDKILDALSYAGSKLGNPIEEYRKRSRMLAQKKLWDFQP